MSMAMEQQKRVAYELTMEYIKKHNVLADVKSNIPKMVMEVEDVYNRFYNNLTDKKIL